MSLVTLQEAGWLASQRPAPRLLYVSAPAVPKTMAHHVHSSCMSPLTANVAVVAMARAVRLLR